MTPDNNPSSPSTTITSTHYHFNHFLNLPLELFFYITSFLGSVKGDGGCSNCNGESKPIQITTTTTTTTSEDNDDNNNNHHLNTKLMCFECARNIGEKRGSISVDDEVAMSMVCKNWQSNIRMHWNHLRTVDLSYKGYSVSALNTMLAQTISLSEVNFNWNPTVNDQILNTLSITASKTLRQVTLRHCRSITEAGITLLLSNSPFLSHLDLSGCYQIGSKSVSPEYSSETENANLIDNNNNDSEHNNHHDNHIGVNNGNNNTNSPKVSGDANAFGSEGPQENDESDQTQNSSTSTTQSTMSQCTHSALALEYLDLTLTNLSVEYIVPLLASSPKLSFFRHSTHLCPDENCNARGRSASENEIAYQNDLSCSCSNNACGDHVDECHWCGYEGLHPHVTKVCARCKIFRYCGKNCQKRDWSSGKHRSICKHLNQPLSHKILLESLKRVGGLRKLDLTGQISMSDGMLVDIFRNRMTGIRQRLESASQRLQGVRRFLNAQADDADRGNFIGLVTRIRGNQNLEGMQDIDEIVADINMDTIADETDSNYESDNNENDHNRENEDNRGDRDSRAKNIIFNVVDDFEWGINLRQLVLSGCPYITDFGLSILTGFCPSLECLNVSRTRVSSQGVFFVLRRLSRLKHLSINKCRVDDVGIQTMTFPTIASSSTSNSQSTSKSFQVGITMLAMKGCPVSIEGILKVVKEWKSLKVLRVSRKTGADLILNDVAKINPRLRVVCGAVRTPLPINLPLLNITNPDFQNPENNNNPQGAVAERVVENV
eukprot:TRINITY_DN2930_c0_g1_i2.p1 TRINITY_DN2930_c0_g1~~TRINITY_DN2930_c0_g1_i2.p1  ORF type:complete len:857 (+),score=160.84 TRINITY_DN2930_c0_g1_i2:247-2571(+)